MTVLSVLSPKFVFVLDSNPLAISAWSLKNTLGRDHLVRRVCNFPRTKAARLKCDASYPPGQSSHCERGARSDGRSYYDR